MKVAIIGAGLAGLACAHELNRNGIEPDIFELKDYIGEALNFPAIAIRAFNMPVNNPLKVLRDKYDIHVKPHYVINEFIMVAPSKTYRIKGNIGYVFRRGVHPGSFLDQVCSNLNVPVNFNANVNLEELRYTYDSVVVATGNNTLTSKLGNQRVYFNGIVRIATVRGKFNTNSVTMWLNKLYSRNGYAYLVADTETEARVVLIVTDVEYQEFEVYWNRFIGDYPFKDIVKMKDLRHTVGLVDPIKLDNTYFTGNAGGFIDSFLGFGTVKALLSGAAAGHCIAKGLDYIDFMKETTRDIKDKYELRKAFNAMDNDDLDRLISFVTKPGIKQLVYNNPFFRITQIVPFVRMNNKLKHR